MKTYNKFYINNNKILMKNYQSAKNNFSNKDNELYDNINKNDNISSNKKEIISYKNKNYNEIKNKQNSVSDFNNFNFHKKYNSSFNIFNNSNQKIMSKI